MSYLLQVEALERQVYLQLSYAPHMDEKGRAQLPQPDQVRAEFDEWLAAESGPVTREDQLFALLGVGGR